MIEEKKLINDTFVIRKIIKKDVNSLMDSGFCFGKDVLRQSFMGGISQNLGLSSRKTGLVLYNVNKGFAVSFLSLVKDTNLIQSIRWVFTNPKFRRKGLATKLILYAFSIAKNGGAKKLFLTSNTEEGIIRWYKKLGFKQILNSSTIWARGNTIKVSNNNKAILTLLNTNSKKDQNFQFKVYERCMGENWIKFFGNDLNNLYYGYPQDFKKFFIRYSYVNKSLDSLIIILKRPLRNSVNTYIFMSSDSKIKPLIKGLMKLFENKGIFYSRITVFNAKNRDCINLFREMNFEPIPTIFVGKHLT